MAGGTAAEKGKGKAKGEMRGKYSNPRPSKGGPPSQLQLTRQARVSEEEGPAPPMKSPTKLPVKWEKGMKEASAINATTQAQAPLIPERRTQLTAEDTQAVPHPGVGDEAEADAKNNQCAGKQKGTTSEAVRSPKPHVQSIAKNKVQKETAEPSKVPPPTERNKAERKQGLGKRKEKAVSVRPQKPHEDILAQKTQGVEIQKETAGSSEDPRMQKKKAKKKPRAMSSEAVGSQIIHENSAAEKKQVYTVCSRVFELAVSTEDEDTAEDSSDQIEEYEKRGPAKRTVKVKKEEKESNLVEIYDSSDEKEVQEDQEEAEYEGGEEESGEEEEKSICEEGEEEENEGGDEEGVDDEEEGGEKAEEEGRESDEDNEDGSDGEKTDEGMGVPGMMKIARMMGRVAGMTGRGVAGMMGRGMRKGIVQKARMEAMKGRGLVLERMEVMKGTGLVGRLRTRRAHPSREGVAAHLG
ncbi:hypothetical protein L7F22_048817 [Adiantum nelumboides]|nr:hypothetical protein [Adiantum nelumboides]